MVDKNVINAVIMDANILGQRCITHDGYVFSSISEPHNIYDALVIRNPCDTLCFSPRLLHSPRTLEEHIQLVNELQLEKALIIGTDINFLLECPSLKYLSIVPTDSAGTRFDFSPLYLMPEITQLHCCTEYGDRHQYIGYIDYLKIHGITRLSVSGKGHCNYNKVDTLQCLSVSGHKGANSDLTDLIGSTQLKELHLTQCGSKSLAGIEIAEFIEHVELRYNRSLADISQLRHVQRTLKALIIQNCPKITDFNCLAELENLEYLQLLGNNMLPSLSFLKRLSKLKRFDFSMDVADGDLTPCMAIPYVYSYKDRKHFNYRNVELPPTKS